MPDTREVGGGEGAEGGGGGHERRRRLGWGWGCKTWREEGVGGEVVEGRLENTGPARTSGDKVSAVHTHHGCLCKVCSPAVRPAGPPSVDDDAGVKFSVSAETLLPDRPSSRPLRQGARRWCHGRDVTSCGSNYSIGSDVRSERRNEKGEASVF